LNSLLHPIMQQNDCTGKIEVKNQGRKQTKGRYARGLVQGMTVVETVSTVITYDRNELQGVIGGK